MSGWGLINDVKAWLNLKGFSHLRTSPNRSVIDETNSTTETLPISDSYMGEAVDLTGYASVAVQIFSDQNSADGGMKFQFSTDGLNWDETHSFTFLIGDARTFQFPVNTNYFRVNYTNGLVEQGVFRLQTILHTSNILTSIHRVDGSLVGDRSTQLVKSVLSGRNTNEDDSYVNVRVTPTGAMLIESPSVNFDAFGRQRVSNVSGIFEHKQNAGNPISIILDETNGVGANITYEKNKARSVLEVGSADGEYQIQQTRRYLPYVPGKGQLILMTGNFRGHETSVFKRIGSFDDRNGLFFESDGTTLNVVRRYYNTGTAQEERVPQASFNFDKLDGTGPSGIVFDAETTHIFTIQYQWLGVGEVTFALNIVNNFGNNIIPVHVMDHANVEAEVYISTPTLPLRYEIRKNGVTTGPHFLDSICMSASSEGGHIPPGEEFSASNFPVGRTVGTTRTPIFAVKLLDTFISDVNRITARILDYFAYSHDKTAFFEVAHVTVPVFDVGASWTPISAESACEYSTDLVTVSSDEENIIFQDIQPLAKGGGGNPSSTEEYLSLSRFIAQNYDSTGSQAFIVYATAKSATTDVHTGITWVEFD